MELNLQNIEDVIFFDKKVQQLLPEFRHLFDQWAVSKRVPGLQNLGKRSVVEFINALEDQHVRKLEEYFGDTIILDKVDGTIVRHYESKLEDADFLCQYADFKQFCVDRDGDNLRVTFWR